MQSGTDNPDLQIVEPVDEALHVSTAIDGAVLRTEHVDVQLRYAFAPAALGFVGAHPAAMEALGMADVLVEILR